jgi:hypothetical protein
MATYVIIKDNKVENIIEAEQDFIDQHHPDAVLLKEGEVASIYWEVKDGEYIQPLGELISVIEEPTEDPA